jgi:hypothetical protein
MGRFLDKRLCMGTRGVDWMSWVKKDNNNCKPTNTGNAATMTVPAGVSIP